MKAQLEQDASAASRILFMESNACIHSGPAQANNNYEKRCSE